MSQRPRVGTGLMVLRDNRFAPLKGKRIGLVTHPAAVDDRLRSAAELIAEAPGLELAVVFGPEHGFDSAAQDLIEVADSRDTHFQIPVVSLYGATFDSLRPTDEILRGLDALVVDLQDIGSRYYTFQATMLLCLEAASKSNLLTIILDRPNPLGGEVVEGPIRKAGYESLVGIHATATRHGMTIGELARLYKEERNIGGELRVIPCEGWKREMDFDQTGLPWVMPSPNMPTLETAFVYPGQCLLEGTNLSEGRGTTRPFEMSGAPWVDGRKAAKRLNEDALPGVFFRPIGFQPTFNKFAGQTCGGVQMHVLDRGAFQPVRTGLAILAEFREQALDHFDWRRTPYEFVADRLAIDLLFGSDRERLALEKGQGWRDISLNWELEEANFRKRRQKYLLY
jgi:uncharacterized protein YbbC (DUF1343 family)